jgi:hypothetical protein
MRSAAALLGAGLLAACTPGVAGPTVTPTVAATTGQSRDPAAVLATWVRALERRDWAAARATWGDFGADSGLAPDEFAKRWDCYQRLRLTVGRGQQEGATGSLYYEAPLKLDALRRDGGLAVEQGSVLLRRVNDVPGSTAERRRWHIERLDLQLCS